jgi:hypothetical protein
VSALVHYVAVADWTEVVEIVAADERRTYVRHVPPRRSIDPDGWDMAMQTADFDKWFVQAGTS